MNENTVSETTRDKLRDLLSRTIQTGNVTLASGRTTDFYIDGRLVTLDPEGLYLVASLAIDTLQGQNVEDRCDAVGGPTSGADPMVAGIGLVARERGWPLRLFFTRKEAKGHGMGRQIEGPPLQSGDRVVIVDDVATSGGSLIQAADVIRQSTSAEVKKALVIVDREEGARERLEKAGIELIALFRRQDLMPNEESAGKRR